MENSTRLVVLCSLLLFATSSLSRAQCPEQPQLQNFTGGGQTFCPCFVSGERAGAVFNLPSNVFPIEILRVGIGWGSQFGSAPDSLEEAIHIYGAGLPNPGTPIFSLPGPVLSDGAINEFNLEPLPGQIIVSSGPFTVALEFFFSNAGDPFSPSVVHDGNGCQAGKNVVFANPGGWFDACSLGVSGDWIFYVIYRQVSCSSLTPSGSVPDGGSRPGAPLEVSRLGGNLLLSWSLSCAATDTDYEVYEGIIGSFTSHAPKLCSTGGATGAVITPGAADRYYLVVPTNGESEGSYGIDGAGAERAPAVSQCNPQETGPCPP